MKEIWVDIAGYMGKYQVSNLARIKSFHSGNKDGIIMRPAVNSRGYVCLVLNMNGVSKSYTVHRLVANAFIPNIDNKPQINHIDGNKLNNHVSNLEWCTNGENQQHAIKEGLRTSVTGEDNHRAKLTNNDVIKIVDLLSKGVYQDEIADMFNIKPSLVSKIKTGRAWSHITGTKLVPIRILDDNDVIEIINLIKSGVRACDVARKYNVSQCCISDIKLGKNRSSITGIKYIKNK